MGLSHKMLTYSEALINVIVFLFHFRLCFNTRGLQAYIYQVKNWRYSLWVSWLFISVEIENNILDLSLF